MRRVKIAGGALQLSELMLGSMTWGTQNSEAEGHAQIDMALDHGVNGIDTAEMYPVNPVSPHTVGRTEEIIGNWFARHPARRGEVVLASKISGDTKQVRGGEGFSGAIIRASIDAQLARLRTDYIDIYQLHWPMRGSYMFRQNWGYDPSCQDRAATEAHMQGVLAAMAELVAAGKVRHFGLSNESAWGTAKWLGLATETGGPRVVTIQNEYSLLCRLYDTDLAELSANEDVKLLAFSPLATGLLTGKYQGGAIPPHSRMTLNSTLSGRATPRAFAATQAYLDIAARHGIEPVAMALAWTARRPFTGAAIFGATSLEQLERALTSAEVTLSAEVLAEISAAHRAHPMPY
jgi:aryl-alcohol dehydrogenase-like predicted oxidoreductase